MNSKVRHEQRKWKKTREVVAIFFTSIVAFFLVYFAAQWHVHSVATVYKSAETGLPVSAELHGHSIPLNEALQGKYEIVWVK